MIMLILQRALWFVVALGVLIVVHEYGHYLVARLCGVKVLRFSVGFGRPLVTWLRGKDHTEWVIAAIPLGGYVKMLDEREGPVDPIEAHRAFNRQNVWKRTAIVAAGPLFNFAFAVLVYTGLFMNGMPEARPILAHPAQGSLAEAAGFRAGDVVRKVNGEAVESWSDFRWRVMQAALSRHSIEVEVETDRQQISDRRLDLSSLSEADIEKDPVRRAGLSIQTPVFSPVVGEVTSGSRAQAAGLQPGDRIVRAQDRSIGNWQEFVIAIQASPEKTLALIVERGSQTLAINVVPEKAESNGRAIGRIGVTPREAEQFYVRVSHGPLDSLVLGAAKTWDFSIFTLKMIGKILLGQVSWKHISGPVSIADVAGQSAEMGGTTFFTFLAIVSISLGVLNLLPVPLLDGGHLMYYAIEIIKGKPVSERVMELGQRVGLALLLVMMAFAFYNDFNRLLTG